MKELIIKGTDEYINYINKLLNKENPYIKNKLIIKDIKINENLLKDNSDIS